MSAPRDPFYAVKDKVIQSLSTADQQYKSMTTTANNNNHQLQQANELKQLIADMQVDINDLAQTITIVETNRNKFQQITDQELNNRILFVTQTRNKLNDMNKTISNFNNKNPNDVRIQLTNKSSSNNTIQSTQSRSTPSGNDPIYGAREQQVQVEREQDEVLDDMTTALDRLQNLAGDINVELKTQDVMLNELDTEIDDASSTMKRTIKRLDKLLATSDKGRLGCIAMLFLIAILLLFLVIYL